VKLDPGGDADILAFGNNKKAIFAARTDRSMIIFTKRASETAAVPPVAFLSRSSKWWP
jgi:hypothetical protein